MTTEDVLTIFKRTGALLEGHFVLRSGLHSRQFFQCALALQHMPDVERLGSALASSLPCTPVQTVVSPAMGGLVIGQEVARQLGCRFIFAEKENGLLVLRRGFKIAPGESCLVIEDVITQGGRVQETLQIIRNLGGDVAAVGVVVDRSGGTVNLGVPLVSLMRMNVETFPPNALPPDLQGLPAIKPGSK
jgi:orotate phosphoribosyltransferase